MPDRIIETAYGTPWIDHELSSVEIVKLLNENDFEVETYSKDKNAFHVIARKNSK